MREAEVCPACSSQVINRKPKRSLIPCATSFIIGPKSRAAANSSIRQEGGADYVDVVLAWRRDQDVRLHAKGAIEKVAICAVSQGRQPAHHPLFCSGCCYKIWYPRPRPEYYGHISSTIADFLVEIHDTHHPIGSGLYYEEQTNEAKRRARDFLKHRVPKFPTIRVLRRAQQSWIYGRGAAYTQTLTFRCFRSSKACTTHFRKRCGALNKQYPRIIALHDVSVGCASQRI